MSDFLTRDAIAGIHDIQTETVEVPEWGGKVNVRGMSGTERDAFEASLIEGKGKNQRTNLKNLRAKLLVRTVVDGNGNRLFNDHDVAMLGQKSSAALNRVFNVAQRLSGVTDDDVEELTEAFDDGQSDDSTSA